MLKMGRKVYHDTKIANWVNYDATYRQRIESENQAMQGCANKMYTMIETHQGEWHPGKKMLRYEKEYFEPYEYAKQKNQKENKDVAEPQKPEQKSQQDK